MSRDKFDAVVSHTFEILKVEDLSFPILLERDAPGFSSLVQMALQEVAAAAEEMLEGEECSSQDDDEGPTQDNWTIDPHILQVQKTNDSLGRLWEDHAVSEETLLTSAKHPDIPA